MLRRINLFLQSNSIFALKQITATVTTVTCWPHCDSYPVLCLTKSHHLLQNLGKKLVFESLFIMLIYSHCFRAEGGCRSLPSVKPLGIQGHKKCIVLSPWFKYVCLYRDLHIKFNLAWGSWQPKKLSTITPICKYMAQLSLGCVFGCSTSSISYPLPLPLTPSLSPLPSVLNLI